MVNILREPSLAGRGQSPPPLQVSPHPPQIAGGALEQGKGPTALGADAVCGNRGCCTIVGFPGGSVVKNPPAKAGAALIWEDPPEEDTPVSLPGESRGQSSLAGCRRGGRRESDAAEQLSSATTPVHALLSAW